MKLTTKNLALTALFIALCTLATMFIRIPLPTSGYSSSLPFYCKKRTRSQAANKKAPIPKLKHELASTTCPGIAFSPTG